MDNDEVTLAYVGFKPCGCCVAAAVIRDDLKSDNAKAVSSWIRSGLRVESRPVEWVRENMRACRCEARPVVSDDLFNAEAPRG